MAVDLMARMNFIARIAADRRCTRPALAAAFVLFCCYYNSNTGRCDPSIKSIAKKIGASERQTRYAIQIIRDLGYIKIEAGGGILGKFGATNSYTPIIDAAPPAVDCTPCNGEQGVGPPAAGCTPAIQRQNPLPPVAAKPVKNQEGEEAPIERTISKEEHPSSASPASTASRDPKISTARGSESAALTLDPTSRPKPIRRKSSAKPPQDNLPLLEAFTPTTAQLTRLRAKAPLVAHKLDLLADEFKTESYWIREFKAGRYSDPARAFENFVVKREGYARDRRRELVDGAGHQKSTAALTVGTPEARAAYDRE